MSARVTGVQGRFLITESSDSQAMALYEASLALGVLEDKAKADGLTPPTVVALGWQVDFDEDEELVYTAIVVLEEA